MIYEGLELEYYYCYQCRRWSTRHFRYRYAVAPLDDQHAIGTLLRQLEVDREVIEGPLRGVSWLRRKLLSASRFFQRYMP
jgi:hypothetical protein